MAACPECRKRASMAPLTVKSISASSKTMKGQFAPSSSDTFLTVAEHSAINLLPSSIEPVKDTFLTPAFETIELLTASPSPVRTDSTPRGNPALSPSTQRANAEKGVCGSGWCTTVQPAAKAAPIRLATMDEGKVHAVIAAPTPTG